MLSSKTTFRKVIFLTLFSFAFVAADSSAQEKNLKAEMNSAYQQLLKTPSDINLNLQYADLAIEAKDYEAAIPPLERILFYNPSLIDVKLKLGILYYLLNSTEVAKSYFQEVKNSKTASKETLAKADDYLTKISQAGAK